MKGLIGLAVIFIACLVPLVSGVVWSVSGVSAKPNPLTIGWLITTVLTTIVLFVVALEMDE